MQATKTISSWWQRTVRPITWNDWSLSIVVRRNSRIKARIPADQGELIVEALEMAMDESYVADDEPEPVAARRADALCEVAETYMNNSENSGSTADRYQVVVHVTAETSVAKWYAGEQMDWDHAVSLMFTSRSE